ncbi:MAG: hypothetical protein CL913_04705 [Deltaproteobacteria bacterium]|nr:hypothetical protein [Deltaproteobacteria bacterium]
MQPISNNLALYRGLIRMESDFLKGSKVVSLQSLAKLRGDHPTFGMEHLMGALSVPKVMGDGFTLATVS